MRFFALLFTVMGLVASTALSADFKWSNLGIPEKYAGNLAISPNGRVAFYTKNENNKWAIWTAMLNGGKPRTSWAQIVQDGQPALGGETLSGLNQKLDCFDNECLYTAFDQSGRISLWSATQFDTQGRPTISRLMSSGRNTNLGLINKLETFAVDQTSGRVYLMADVGNQRVGLYELLRNGSLVFLTSPAQTQNSSWWPAYMLVRDNVFLFLGVREIANARGVKEKIVGLFGTNLTISNLPAKAIVLQNNVRDRGDVIIGCCQFTAGPEGFLIQYHLVLDRTQRIKLMYANKTLDGKLQEVAEGALYASENRSLNGVRPLAPSNWAEMPYVSSQVVNNDWATRKDSLFFWNPSTKTSRLVAVGGDNIFANEPFSGFGCCGGTTQDGRMVTTIFHNSDSSVAKLVSAIQPLVSSLSPLSAMPNDKITVVGSNLFLEGTTTEVRVNQFYAIVTKTGVGLTFILPASVPSGKHKVFIELKDSGGILTITAGELDVNNNYPLPVFTASGVVNAADFQNKPIAPGTIASIFGVNLTAHNPEKAISVPLPTVLAKTKVLINGKPAPLLLVSASQINFQVPFEEVRPSKSEIDIQIEKTEGNGTVLLSPSVKVRTGNVGPGFFQYDSRAIVTKNYQLVTPTNPASEGDVISLWLTGLGRVEPDVQSGHPSPITEPFSRTIVQPQVKIGGLSAKVFFSGLAPGFIGLYQLNILVPLGIPTGSTREESGMLSVGTVTENFTLFVK